MTEELPRPVEDTVPAWEHELARALGYTFESTGTSAPTAWNLPFAPFAFLEDTNEVIVWEVDGEPDERGRRKPRIDPARRDAIALRPIRRPLPEAFELVNLTDTDGVTHRIALRKASGIDEEHQ